MLKEIAYHANVPEVCGNERISHVKTYKTAQGILFLQSCCSPMFVERLQVDEGLRAFARLPEREHQLLIELAKGAVNKLTLAYTPAGKIVGQATLAPLDGWWQGIPDAYEIAIEVSTPWRKLGVAHQLLSLTLDFESLEEKL